MDDDVHPVAATILCLIGIFVGVLLGWQISNKSAKDAAVKSGHAEWVVVDETGKTEFRWKECE